ncbi:serine/threonine protein kinase [Micromonospora sp. DR5-3]|uniref:serine/threonine protein kinase n=1 Tax=unclassified Micromonospora TaxID=2617518 RepID=UPI0011D65BBB|nr:MULTISPECIES: serine/threonine protein kinase [unclassified Micromonospora]MCW3813644.1 serine/threonine protein kinase [Micromonospora sp. DR5-3]TYC25658.1 serine/threonine protein kinase [Micromonospora sp. MP36]
MRTEEAIRLVAAARDDADLFGTDAPARRYRKLVAALHPDRLGAADPDVRAAATDALVEVTTRWRGGGGTMLGDYPLRRLAYIGDLADLYDVGADRLLKLPRNPADNDLTVREARALKVIEERGDPRHLPYVPRLVDSLTARDPATGVARWVNVLAAAPGLHSLDEVRRAYPDGLDPRDAAWMWRRLLVALGLAHRAGVVHGAVLPRHVLIEPDAHGLVLVDWCFSVVGEGAVPALVPGHEDWYPPEVTGKQPCGPGTDLAMAARCMAWLMADRIPRELRAFAAGCVRPALNARPDDAWRLLGELDEVLERCYGPRTFRPFTLNP